MKTRIYFLDNLRTFLILMVVVLHSGLVYESVLTNSWIVNDPVKDNNIGLIRLYLDLFVMFSIFFISGYFLPSSVKKQSAFSYLKSKFKRIMLPWLIAVVTLIPAYKFIFLYSRGLPQEEWYSYFHIFERAGTDLSFYANNPVQNWLWFLPVLFAFQVIYLGLYKIKVLEVKMPVKIAVLLTFVLGTAYGVTISTSGLTGWYHSAIFHFQNERLGVYFLSFLLGTLCNSHRIFERKLSKKVFIASNVVLTIALGVYTAVALNTFFNIIDPQREYYFISAFADRILYYASGMASMLSLLHVLVYSFKKSLNKTTPFLSELSRNSYSVYIVHVVVLGVIALAMMNIQLPGMLKFLILSILTFAVSNMMISSWRMATQKQFNMKRASNSHPVNHDSNKRVTSNILKIINSNEMKTIVTSLVVIFIMGTAFQGYPGSVKNNGNVVTQQDPTCTNNIHAAIINNDLESVKTLIASGSDINEKEPASGSSPLTTAAMMNRIEIAKALVEAGADLNQANNDGSTALHTAAFFCRTEIVKLLLENGADKSIRNNSNATALESVQAPFDMVKPIYDYIQSIYEPIGLKLDMERLQKNRPEIAKLLTAE